MDIPLDRHPKRASYFICHDIAGGGPHIRATFCDWGGALVRVPAELILVGRMLLASQFIVKQNGVGNFRKIFLRAKCI